MAIQEPYRMAVSLFGESQFKKNDTSILNIIHSGRQSPQSSSLGRVFDGVAGYLGLVNQIEYEAQGAVLLEHEVYKKYTMPTIKTFQQGYPCSIRLQSGCRVLDFSEMFKQIKREIHNLDTPTIALKFHTTIVKALYDMACEIGYKKVVLSGGCFQNQILLTLLADLIGPACHTHKNVPSNDGGLSLGQAYLGGLGLCV